MCVCVWVNVSSCLEVGYVCQRQKAVGSLEGHFLHNLACFVTGKMRKEKKWKVEVHWCEWWGNLPLFSCDPNVRFAQLLLSHCIEERFTETMNKNVILSDLSPCSHPHFHWQPWLVSCLCKLGWPLFSFSPTAFFLSLLFFFVDVSGWTSWPLRQFSSPACVIVREGYDIRTTVSWRDGKL